MKQTVSYDFIGKGKTEVEYDDESPCLICGEPVGGASMGGTAICPSCDMGKCRYCKMTIFVMKESIDGGRSKREVLQHMKYHNEKEPKAREEYLQRYRRFHGKLKQEKVK